MSAEVKQLVAGLDVKERTDGSVITVKSSEGKRVAEVCIGKGKVRVNFAMKPAGALAKLLTGKSKSWPGGGVVVTAENVQLVRAALLAAAGSSAPTREARRTAAKRRVSAASRGSRKATAAA